MELSSTRVKTYKACKRAYFFRYVENLVPVEVAQPLTDGKTYHGMLEALYNEGGFEVDIENPKISAMAMAYKKYIYPKFNVARAEEWFDFKLTPAHTLIGRFDGIADDGCVVEHKSTSADIDDEYIYNLQWDEQILNYMLGSGKNKIYYTVCKKPTIRQKQNETAEEFFERCVAWYDEDTDKKIRVISVERNAKEIVEQKEALKAIARDIIATEKKGEKAFYRNCSHCTAYGRKCEFASICLDYNPKLQYVEFTKKGR